MDNLLQKLPMLIEVAAKHSYRDVNSLVMDFLIQEGYPAAAARFAEEANIEVKEDNVLINERVQIRDAIFKGDLQTAIEEINDIDPQVCGINYTPRTSI